MIFGNFLVILIDFICTIVLKQIVNLHYMLSKSVVKSRPNVLWCYKNKLEISRFLVSPVI